MKKFLFTSLLALTTCLGSFAQISISLATGTPPVVPAGWSLGGSATAPGPHVQLTPNAGGQDGRVWYTVPQNLTACGAFVVDFDYQIIPPTGSPTPSTVADGMAFWIVNPLTGFVGGGGIGLPTNPNGLVLIFDTYNNDGVPNDPLISLYGYPAGFVGAYTEGVTANRIASLNNQTFLYDGGWHHAKITYSAGNIKVYLDYSAVPNMTGFFPIATAGYFGFCASTGAVTSVHNVRNVYINADNISAIVGPGVVCMGGTTATYTDSTAGGVWSSTVPAVGTISSTGVFTPLSPGTTTISYVYSGTCATGRIITVNPAVLNPIGGPTPLCSSTAATYTNTATGGTWSASPTATGTIDGSSGVLTPIYGGVMTVTYTLPAGCYATKAVTINTAPPVLSINPTPASICNNGSLTLTGTTAGTYNLFAPQSWEAGVPTTAGAPVNQWTYTGTVPSLWHQIDAAMTTTPAVGVGVSGTYVAKFNCRSSPTGTTAAIYSPSFSMTGVATATLSFWVYRDVSAFNTAAYNTEGVTVYVNTTPAVGGTNLGFVPRRGGMTITGPLTGTSTTATSGWFQYTVTIPSAYTGLTNYIVFSGLSNNGNNLYLDQVTLTGTIGAPTWTPATWLYNDAAFTSAYAGAALNPVYMHPTGVTAPTTITYSVTNTNGLCSSSGTGTVTVNPNPAAITGTTLVCVAATTTLNSTTPGGTWSSGATAIATVNPATGVVGGVAVGTAVISYSIGTCYTTTVVTVVTSPGSIGGPAILCMGNNATYTNPTPGGAWSSQNPAVGSIDAATGIATGIAAGTTIITYGIGTCYSTMLVSVNPVPLPISGSLGVCVGATTLLTSGPSGGFWSSSVTSIATITPLGGLATGLAPGTTLISYTRIGCSAVATLNVVSTPGPITGTLSTCYGSTTTLSHGTPGGTWTSGNTAVATVGSNTGIVTGVAVAGGTAVITYTVSAGCFTTATVTVFAAPPPPTGTMTVCVGATTTLNHVTTGGIWSAPCPGVATIGAGSGVVTGAGAGTCVVTYTLPSGCATTATVVVHPVPGAITGTMAVCQGGTSVLGNSTPSGTWISGTTTVANIGTSSGIVTTGTAGTSIITYRLSTGCQSTAVFTVNAAPAPVTGTYTLCAGSSTVLSTTTSPVAWSNTTPSVGSVSGTGVYSGTAAGVDTVIATSLSGCTSRATVTVNAAPGAITGTPGLCVGSTTTLNASPTGGVWASGSAVASIVTSGVSAGTPYVVIGGVAPGGTATISYTLAGCTTTTTVTVNTLPGAIGGTLSTCVGQCTNLTNSAGGGTWVSSNTAVGTIGTSTGTLCGITAGTTNITYSLGTGCTVTAVATVYALPGAIGGGNQVCEGQCINLTASPAPGTWTSGNPAVGTIGSGTGTFCGIAAGTSLVSYTLATGCRSTAVITVNALPGAITGLANVCVGACATLNSTPAGGTWLSGNSAVGTINSTSGVFCGTGAGTSNVTYTLPTGCRRSDVMVINPLPTSVGGGTSVCAGQCITLTGNPAGGGWAGSSPAIATIGASSGSLCGIGAGTVDITYTLPTTCSLVVTRTVNALPSAITGGGTMCVGLTTTLTSTPAGGAWASGNTTVATVDAAGVVTGQSGTFTASISYTLSTGCRTTTIVTVMGLPGTVTGSLSVCENGTTTLNCTPAGGTWSNSCPSIATIGSSSGVVTGIASGTCTMTYLLGTGCIRTAVVTVNPGPSAITGTATVCVGTTTTLTSTPGGTWTSSNPSIASVGSSTGIVTGHSGPLTATITYSNGTGCTITRVVTVYALPANITGVMQLCAGTTTTLNAVGTPGGSWSSSNTGVATIDGTTGVVTGQAVLVTSTATITYALGTGCIKTAVVTVNPLPADITGVLTVCEAGATTLLGNVTSGGTWSSTNPGVATIDATGLVTGVVAGGPAGTSTISYKITATGCYKTAVVTVNALPSSHSGPSAVCVNESITLTSTPAGGTWSSPSPTVISTTGGLITGVSAGTALISYTAPVTGCVRTGIITVNGLPAAIGGSMQICEGQCTTLSNSSGGGTWASSTPSVGSISPGGTICGTVAGTTTISYTFVSTGCRITSVFTVNGLPTPVTGPDGFCNFSLATYGSTPGGGIWSSADTSILEFTDSVNGIAYGKMVDTVTITYTLPTGCKASKRVYMILAPYAVDGPDSVCFGSCITMSNIIGGGTWSSSNAGVLSVAPATPATATACGLTTGTANVTYVLSTGCYTFKTVTVNPIPSGITGSLQVCEGLTTDLDNTTPGGQWVSADGSIATVGSIDGLVTGVNGGTSGRTVTITYALSTGCSAQVDVTVNPAPAPITGPSEVCEGLSATLNSASGGGSWAVADPAVGTIGSTTGIFSALSAGAPGVNGPGRTVVTYTLPTGCKLTHDMTVNPLPADIVGISNLCVGDVTVLGSAPVGGTWISSNTAIGTVDAVGIVGGVGPGSFIVTYMLPTGCIKTWPMSVNAIPDAIGGSLTVCAGFATNLTSGPAGGVWSQAASSTLYGTINTVTGVVSGISGGLVPVSYTLGSGCRTTAVVTVITLPPVISGTPNLCEAGGTTTMLHSIPGGTWSISNPSLATIDATTGVVTGIMAGTAVVTYTVGTGCFNVHTITVNPLPAVITGPSPLEVCEGSQITLASATPGGAWISDATDKATIGTSTGVLTGVGAGIAPIRYHISATGCERSVTVTVNPTPAAITGNPNICIGSAVWYTSASMGGVWSISNPGVATLLPTSTNVVTALPVSLGVATITYQFPGTGCKALRSVTVQPLPVVYNVTGGGNYCAGGAGVHIGLSNSQAGVSYVLYRGAVAAGYISGTGFPIDFGLLTVAGTYTVQATNPVTGCQMNMAGSAVVVVNPLVTPTVTINVTPADSVCPGEIVTLNPVSATAGPTPGYVWKVNGVTVASGPAYSFVPADGDVASVVMTSSAGCLATATATGSRRLTVLPDALPVAGMAATPNDSLCQHTPVTFTAMPEYGGTAPLYAWFLNGGATPVSTGPAYTYTPANGDVVKYRLTSNYRCRLANTVMSADVTLYVEPMTVPTVAIYATPGFTVPVGKPVKLTAVPHDAGAAPTFQWKVNGYPVAGATTDTYISIFNDYDSIACEVVSSGLCNNIGTSEWVFISTTVGVQPHATGKNDIRLVPNPNKGLFTLRGTIAGGGNEDVTVDVANMLGQVVYKGTLHLNQGRVDAAIQLDNSLANGMYILTLHTGAGQQSFHFVMEQ